jgi:hypothetical protein
MFCGKKKIHKYFFFFLFLHFLCQQMLPDWSEEVNSSAYIV